jgi:hypothetical protein
MMICQDDDLPPPLIDSSDADDDDEPPPLISEPESDDGKEDRAPPVQTNKKGNKVRKVRPVRVASSCTQVLHLPHLAAHFHAARNP